MTTRRRCLVALGAGLASPLVAWAQAPKTYRIGVLEATSATQNRANLEALLQGLRELGYVEGRNAIIDYRSAEGRTERFVELAADLVRARPDVILVRGTPAALAAKGAGTIPIVMTAVADPVGSGVVASLAKPGGNVTGLTSIVVDLVAKRLEIVKELVPASARIAAFFNLSNQVSSRQWKELDRVARSLGLQARVMDVRDAEGLGRAFDAAVKQRVGALLVSGEGVMLANRRSIIELSARHRIPTMYPAHEFIDAGGLISYGVHHPHLYYRAAAYVDRIFKGAKPGELPIEQPTKLELVINQKTAKQIGLAVPRSLLLRADRVIE